jgi:4-amino-4-deoxy-L-arabinose transferase-like glycosyltransferase
VERPGAPAPPSPGGWGGGATGGWREVPRIPISRLVAAVEANPARAFAVFATGHVILWTLLPALLCRNLPLDVIEGIAYGQEWQIGYWKHPPLPWWLVDITRDLGGPRLWPLFLLGQLAAVVCFWAVWRLGRRLLRPVEALVAVVLLDGCVVFTIPTMEFNHNIVQLPIWGLAGWSYYQALVDGRRVDWMLLGLWLALAFYAKYAAVTLVAPLLLFAVLEGRARRCWRTPGPYLAVLVFLAVLGPHLAWLVRNEFSPIVFASGRAEKATGPFHLAYIAGDTVVSALSLVAPAFLLFAALLGGRLRAARESPLADAFARRYLVVLALGPFATAVVTSVLMGRGSHTRWATPFWCFIGLLLVALWRPRIDTAALRRLAIAWIALTGVLMGVQTATQLFHVGGGERWATQFPGDRFAAVVTETWRRETGDRLAYVVGDFWLAGTLIFFSADSPRLFHNASLFYSPWIEVADVRRRGAVLVWPSKSGIEMPSQLREAFPKAEDRAPLVIRAATWRGEREWRVGWALLRPDGR